MIKGIEAYTTHCCLSYPHGADIHHICTTMCRANFHFYTFASRRPLQPLTRPHFTTARRAAPAGGRFVHFTSHWADALSRFQPNFSGLGSFGASRRAWPQTWPAWYPARRTYWRIACFVGYLSVYLSICLSVYLSVCLSVCLSVYLSIYLSLFLQNLTLASHPVSAWKAGNASHLSVSNLYAMWVVSRYWNVFHVPNNTMSCPNVSLLAVLTMPTVLTKILLHPSLAPSAAW